MAANFTRRLKKNNYEKPEHTYTEKLSKDEIAEKLEDYQKVDDINKVSLGTHLRYFITKDGKKLFRMGGQLFKNDGLPEYVILSNGVNSWSVQTEGTTFFRKLSINEIKQEYENQIQAKDDKIKELLHVVKAYRKQYGLLN